MIDGIPVNTELLDNLDDWDMDERSVAIHDVVYVSKSGKVAQAIADNTEASQCVGVVKSILTPTKCRILTQGKIENFGVKLSPGECYYLSDKTPGRITLESPDQQIPVGVAVSPSTFYFNPRLTPPKPPCYSEHTVFQQSLDPPVRRTNTEESPEITSVFPIDCDALTALYPEGWKIYWIGTASSNDPRLDLHLRLRNNNGVPVGSGTIIGECATDSDNPLQHGNSNTLWGLRLGPFDSGEMPTEEIVACSVAFWVEKAKGRWKQYHLGGWKLIAVPN